MATYQAELNQTVQVVSDDALMEVYPPLNPLNGHWFAVKVVRIYSAVAPNVNIIPQDGSQIEDIDGAGPVAQTAVGFNYEYSRFIYIDGIWWREHPRPMGIPELFDYAGTALTLGTNTPIPLSLNDPFNRQTTYWAQTTAGDVGGVGNIKALKPFVGIVSCRVYFEFTLTGNNQDAIGVVDLYVINGSPVIIQGKGNASSFAGPRSGVFYMSTTNNIVLTANTDDIIGLRGSEDPAQSGITSILDDSGLIINPI